MTDGTYTFVCNECGKPVETDSLAGACREADAHENHAFCDRNFYVLNPEDEVEIGEKERDPRDSPLGL